MQLGCQMSCVRCRLDVDLMQHGREMLRGVIVIPREYLLCRYLTLLDNILKGHLEYEWRGRITPSPCCCLSYVGPSDSLDKESLCCQGVLRIASQMICRPVSYRGQSTSKCSTYQYEVQALTSQTPIKCDLGQRRIHRIPECPPSRSLLRRIIDFCTWRWQSRIPQPSRIWYRTYLASWGR